MMQDVEMYNKLNFGKMSSRLQNYAKCLSELSERCTTLEDEIFGALELRVVENNVDEYFCDNDDIEESLYENALKELPQCIHPDADIIGDAIRHIQFIEGDNSPIQQFDPPLMSELLVAMMRTIPLNVATKRLVDALFKQNKTQPFLHYVTNAANYAILSL